MEVVLQWLDELDDLVFAGLSLRASLTQQLPGLMLLISVCLAGVTWLNAA
jgi:hypothetical protein